MSASHTKDASVAASRSTSSSSEITRQSRENDPTVTTEAEKQEEEEVQISRESRKFDDHTPRGEDEGKEEEEEEKEEEEEGETKGSDAPPLPDEISPPLPKEAPPGQDDGWEPLWDPNAQAYYFFNRYTGVSQWENPRVPNAASAPGAPAPAPGPEDSSEKVSPPLGGYNPAIHGDYDPTAPYAQQYEQQDVGHHAAPGVVNTGGYDAVGSFNRFTGRWQGELQNPEYHNDENKSRRQMNAYFDVDAAANSHDGRSLRAERSAKKLSKKELKMFKEKRREKKEEKRRAWLRD
ncbi:hypothetical protein BDW62DRAFT_182730 [Aspergillus aurantiobrunneus]